MLLGSALILVLLLAAAAIFMADEILARLAGRERIVAVLPGPAPIVRGSGVWIGGRAVGEVERVDFLPVSDDSAARIAVTLAIPADLRAQVRSDAHVRLTSARMIGPRVVDIVPGSPGAPPLAPDDTLRTRPTVAAAEVMRALQALRDSAAALTSQAASLREPVARRAAALDRLTMRLAEAGRAFDAVTADLERGPLARTLADPRFAALLASLDSTVAAIGPGLARATEPFGRPEARDALAALRARSAALRARIGRLRAAMDSTGGGMLTRMAADSALARALADVRAQLDSLIAEAKAKPLRFVF